MLNSSKEYLDEFKTYLEVERNFSEHTSRAYISDVLSYIIWLDSTPVEQADFNKLREYIYFIQRFEYQKTTIARKIAALRTFYKYLYREHVVETNPALSLNAPKRGKSLPKFLSTEEIENILNNIKIDTPAGYRNRVILELLWATGMRVSELSGLNLGDLNLENNEIKVFGKGAKERIVLVSTRAKEFLEQYLKTVRNLLAPGYEVSNFEDAPVFINNTGYELSEC